MVFISVADIAITIANLVSFDFVLWIALRQLAVKISYYNIMTLIKSPHKVSNEERSKIWSGRR